MDENIPIKRPLGRPRKNPDNKPKHISSVELFWTLVDKYGFQFGKKQNVDEIKRFVPATYLPDFDRGLAM